MNSSRVLAIRFLIVAAAFAALFLLFPRALAFTEMAARELRYLWWLILLAGLGVWLLWGFRRKP